MRSSQLRRRIQVDSAVAFGFWMVLAAPTIVMETTSLNGSFTITAPWPFVFSSALVLPLVWRRSYPVNAALLWAAVVLIQLAVGFGLLPANLVALLLLYTLASYGSRATGLLGLIGASVLGMIGAARITANNSASLFWFVVATAFGLAVLAVPWLLGRLAKQRRLTVEQAQERAARLEREQLQERALAQADERARIAREMHDIVAHSLSVIIAQADGAQYAAEADPEVAVTTLGTIAKQGREALGEMRRLLGVLRIEDEAETAPTPGILDIAEPVQAARGAGLPTSFEQHGVQRAPLPAGAELAAYRVVQEALTNALKHAGPGAEAHVELRWRPTGLEIDVRDDGRGSASRIMNPEAAQSGQGLRGMRERVALYGGSLAAGPSSGGGFRVRADIPYEEQV